MNKDIRPYNDKHQKHGLWEVYYDDTLMYKCFYHNDKEVGYDEWCYHNGKMREKKYHI